MKKELNSHQQQKMSEHQPTIEEIVEEDQVDTSVIDGNEDIETIRSSISALSSSDINELTKNCQTLGDLARER